METFVGSLILALARRTGRGRRKPPVSSVISMYMLNSQPLQGLLQLTASVYGNRPIRNWPKVIGSIYEISIPRRVRVYTAPTPACPSNVNILFDLLDAVQTVDGAIAECGVFQGSTLVAMALLVRQSGRRRQFFGFDSFEGFGDSIRGESASERADVDPYMRAEGFSNTSVELVQRKLDLFGLADVRLIKGYFDSSLTRCPESVFALVHMDCDTYVAYRDCLSYFYPRLSAGGVVVLDEYNDPAWPGCRKAVDEFLADKPEHLEKICRDNYVKSFFVKR